LAHLDKIRNLVSFGPRNPGSAGERRAAEFLADELRALGRDAQIEAIRVRPAYHFTHALHAALAVAGSVISVHARVLGAIILLLVAVSMYGDLSARFYALRLLTPRRRSQNVTSGGGRADAPARVVLTAHYDAGRGGLLFARRRRPPGRLMQQLRKLAGPIDIVFWSVIVALLLSVLRLFTGDSTALTAAQFAVAVVLLTGVMLLSDVGLSDVVPGASDNASGVAAVLELARRLAAEPLRNLEVWIVFPGANEGLMLGMRQWMRAHAGDLDPRRTFFVNVDSVGAGSVRLVQAEGFMVLTQHDARLVELGRRVPGGSPHVLRFGTDGVIPTARGFSAISICSADDYGRIPNYHRASDSPERIEPEAVDQAIDFAEELVRRIDTELVPAIVPSLASAR
jgi:Peptidase family M28